MLFRKDLKFYHGCFRKFLASTNFNIELTFDKSEIGTNVYRNVGMEKKNVAR